MLPNKSVRTNQAGADDMSSSTTSSTNSKLVKKVACYHYEEVVMVIEEVAVKQVWAGGPNLGYGRKQGVSLLSLGYAFWVT